MFKVNSFLETIVRNPNSFPTMFLNDTTYLEEKDKQIPAKEKNPSKGFKSTKDYINRSLLMIIFWEKDGKYSYAPNTILSYICRVTEKARKGEKKKSRKFILI